MISNITPPRLKSQHHSQTTRPTPHRRPHGIFQYQITPDNAIVLHHRSESPSKKVLGDKTEQKRLTERGLLIRERETIDLWLKQLGDRPHLEYYQPQVLPRLDDESLQAHLDRKQSFQTDWIDPFRFPVPIPHKVDLDIHTDQSGQTIKKPKLYWIPLDGYGTVGHIKEVYLRDDLLSAREKVCERLSSFTQKTSLTSPPDFRTFSEQVAKPKRIPTFTRHAAKRIRNGGGAIDKLCPKESTFLLTLTCPGSSARAENYFRKNLSYIKKRLNNRISDRMKRHGCTIFSFYAVEVGQNGFKKCHLHWCIASPDWPPHLMKLLAYSMKDLWYEVLAEISDKSGVDLFERHTAGRKGNQIDSWRNHPEKWKWDIQQVEKSVGAYLSKYASKASAYSKRQSEFSLGDKGRDCPLKRWWGMNNKLRQAIKMLSFKSAPMRINQLSPELQELLADATALFEYEQAYTTRYMVTTDCKQFSLVNGQFDIYYLKSEDYLDAVQLFSDLECVFKALEFTGC